MITMSRDGYMRPGGIEITKEGLEHMALSKGASVADIGCGVGRTVEELLEQGYKAQGIDINASEEGEYIKPGNGEEMPFGDKSMDGLIFECSFSKMQNPEAVLCECRRVLKPRGRLMISDMYARGKSAQLDGALGRIEALSDILDRAYTFGFKLIYRSDHTASLMSYWAGLIFESGTEEVCRSMGADIEALKVIKSGYFMAVFEKMEDISTVDNQVYAISKSSPEELEAWQLSMIKAQIEHAKKGRYYGEKLKGIEIADMEDVKALPITTPEDLAGDSTSFLCVSQREIERIVTQPTSGTSGKSKRMHFTVADIQMTVEFFKCGLSDFVKSGERAMIFNSNTTENSMGDILVRAFAALGVKGEVYGVISDVIDAAEQAKGSAFFIGMPGDMLRLCRAAPELRPKGVLLSADYIADSIVQALEQEWGCFVIPHFGMTETCYGGAVGCRQGGSQHIRHGDYYFEILDENNNPLPFGCPGNLVLTSLRSQAMPLIRYKTGDIASMESGGCICGGSYPRLCKVLGRQENLEDKLNIHALDELMYSIKGVREYRAVLSNNILKLEVEGGGVDTAEIEAEFEIQVHVEYTKHLGNRGKRRLEKRECV